MKKTNYKGIFSQLLVLILFVTLAVPVLSYAADTDYTLLAPLPTITKTGSGAPTLMTKINFQNYVQYAFNLFIALAAVAAVVMIVWGGIEYMASSIPSVKTDGIGRVKNALFGLVLVLCSFLILRTINPQLVNIPSTLVPALGLTPVNTSKDFFASLTKDLNDQAKAEIKAAKDAQIAVANLEAKKADLQKQAVDAETNGLPIDSITAEIANNENAITEQKAIGVIAIAKGMIDKDMAAALINIQTKKSQDKLLTTDLVDKEIQSGITAIEADRDIRNTQLSGLGSYDQSGPGSISDYARADVCALKLSGINAVLSDANVVRGFWDTVTYGLVGNKLSVQLWPEGTGLNDTRRAQNIGTPKDVFSQYTTKLAGVAADIEKVRDPALKATLQTQLKSSQDLLQSKLGAFK